MIIKMFNELRRMDEHGKNFNKQKILKSVKPKSQSLRIQ